MGACGAYSRGQCNLPPLDDGVTYTQVSAGTYHTVLLRSDGRAAACGANNRGQCTPPSTRSWFECGICAESAVRFVLNPETRMHTTEMMTITLRLFLEHGAIHIAGYGLCGDECVLLKAAD